jgi:glucosyl-3-phosphoglycerate synthase
MITIIIPALNEEEHIGYIIKHASSQPRVSEVIVVDDKSTDKTASIALENGAKVITSATKGKGSSMKDGIMSASNDIVCFLDGDIEPYPHDTISLLTDPIINGKADFVKSTFGRNAGRVTELVAKPLLSILFPELLKFSQPLSGMIAGRKSILQTVDYMDDYGVDIGILIEMHLKKVKIKEVKIGYLDNKSKPWQELGSMSREVARAIILKAGEMKGQARQNGAEQMLGEVRSQLEIAMQSQIRTAKKLVLFDMDNTLLLGRFIDHCAEAFGFKKELTRIRSFETDSLILTKRIATLLKGKPISDLLAVVGRIPVVKGTGDIISELKRRGYLVGIISDGYDCITNYLKNKLSLDFTLSNELEFSNNICTGEVKIPSFFFKDQESWCNHAICKSNALLNVLKILDIDNENTIVIGDSLNDLCMIKNAGLGIAFNSGDELLNYHADVIIKNPSFKDLLNLAI